MNGTEATPSIRTLAALLILVPALCGLLLQLLLGIALYSGWKTFRGNTFYLITVQIMCCDVYALALDLYAAFPLTLTGIQYMGDSVTFYYLPLAFEGIAFNGIFMLSFLLTSNRFLLFIFPRVHRLVFTTTGTKILSLMVWAYVFTLITVSNVAGCRKEFSKEYFYFWYNCSYGPKACHYKNFVYISSCVITSLMTLMYVIIYIKLKVGKQGLAVSFHGSVKQEVKYLVQTLLICVLIFFEVTGFIFLPFLGVQGYGQFYLNILLNLIIISNNLMTPIVILSFNNDVRQQLTAS